MASKRWRIAPLRTDMPMTRPRGSFLHHVALFSPTPDGGHSVKLILEWAFPTRKAAAQRAKEWNEKFSTPDSRRELWLQIDQAQRDFVASVAPSRRDAHG